MPAAGGRPEDPFRQIWPRRSCERQDSNRIVKSPRAFVETLTTPVTYDSTNADELLGSLGVDPCPPLETYVDKLVEFVQERTRERRAIKTPPAEIEDPLV